MVGNIDECKSTASEGLKQRLDQEQHRAKPLQVRFEAAEQFLWWMDTYSNPEIPIETIRGLPTTQANLKVWPWVEVRSFWDHKMFCITSKFVVI